MFEHSTLEDSIEIMPSNLDRSELTSASGDLPTDRIPTISHLEI
ncbi:hypothetical protein [Chamaesiphon minutus]|nr:hypothetical protein [Chamaesiphon minutus]